MADVTIRVVRNGPYQVSGDFQLVDHDGDVIPTTPGKRISLCRCGASVRKPFCDSTHTKIGFMAAEAAQQKADEQSSG